MQANLVLHTPYQDKLDPWSSHSVIRNWLQSFPTRTRILDVGTATGTLGRLCQGWDFILTGLEPNQSWASQARPYYREIIVGTLDEAPKDFLGGHQVVVCADVLEHMPDPENSLRGLVELQPPGAVFIISVPNVANLWVRLNLFLGNFDCTERGILDCTHLHFFTRRSFVEFLGCCGLAVQEMQITAIPLPLVHPFFRATPVGRFLHHCLAFASRNLPTLLGYQFVAQCVKAV